MFAMVAQTSGSNWPNCRPDSACSSQNRSCHAGREALRACPEQRSSADCKAIMGSAQLLQELSGHVDRMSELQSKHSRAFEDLRLQQTEELQQHSQHMLQKHRDLLASISAETGAHQKELQRFAEEKAALQSQGLLGGDIIELNVGGVHMSTTRNTLTQAEGSMLAAMFSDLWQSSLKLDKDGRVFLNYNPNCFGKILSYLRSKAIEQQGQPIPQPSVEEQEQADFHTLVAHLGLQEHMGYNMQATRKVMPLRFARNINLEISAEGNVAQALHAARKSAVVPLLGACSAAPLLVQGKVYYVKCQVLCESWVFLGISQAHRLNSAENDNTSYGWSTGRYEAGRVTTAGEHFRRGQIILFKVDFTSQILSVRVDRVSCLDMGPIALLHSVGSFFFCVTFAQDGGEVKLLEIVPEDIACFN